MADDDDLYFAWVFRANDHPAFSPVMPIIFREGVARSSLGDIYAKWKLRRHERWMTLAQLAEIYPLKAAKNEQDVTTGSDFARDRASEPDQR
jgi:hypothetical protein